MRTPLALTMLAAGVSSLPAQATTQPTPSAPAWDVTQARGKTRDIDFTTSEGTWMSVDISPDGTWIVFDLLGHVYRMPAAGGEATALTQNSGVALNFHPRISPDGKLDRVHQRPPRAEQPVGDERRRLEPARGLHRPRTCAPPSPRGPPTATSSSSGDRR